MRFWMVCLILVSMSLGALSMARELDNKDQKLDGTFFASVKIEEPDKEERTVEKATVVIEERTMRIRLPGVDRDVTGKPRAFWDFGYKVEADMTVNDIRYHVRIMRTN